MIPSEKKLGLKLTVISEIDFPDYREVCDAIIKLGYSAKVIDNGNTVFQKEKE